MVDQIVFDHYGSEDMTEVVLDTNPGLAALGPVLSKGVLINLPATEVKEVRQTIRLWD